MVRLNSRCWFVIIHDRLWEQERKALSFNCRKDTDGLFIRLKYIIPFFTIREELTWLD